MYLFIEVLSIIYFIGTIATTAANSISGGIFFYVFEDGKKAYNYHRDTASVWLTMLISLRAGTVTMVLTNPIWWIRTRLILCYNEIQNYRNGFRLFFDVVKDMYKREGTISFFRGLGPSIGMSFYGVIQMAMYERMSKIFGVNKWADKKIPDLITFIIGGISRSTASFVLYPINLIRTRQMKQRYSIAEAEKIKRKLNIKAGTVEEKEVFYASFRHSAKTIWINEGVKGFFKGWFANLLRVFPHSGVFFLMYEGTLKILHQGEE